MFEIFCLNCWVECDCLRYSNCILGELVWSLDYFSKMNEILLPIIIWNIRGEVSDFYGIQREMNMSAIFWISRLLLWKATPSRNCVFFVFDSDWKKKTARLFAIKEKLDFVCWSSLIFCWKKITLTINRPSNSLLRSLKL